MHSRSIRRSLLGAMAAATVALPLGLSAPAATAATSVPPTITARPDTVMVNTPTKLTGRNFPARTTETLVECSQTTWVVPADPCDTSNSVTVRTNARGRFTKRFTVDVCPAPSSATGAADLSQLCYIGVVHPSGIDTVSLQPVTGIVVTYP